MSRSITNPSFFFAGAGRDVMRCPRRTGIHECKYLLRYEGWLEGPCAQRGNRAGMSTISKAQRSKWPDLRNQNHRQRAEQRDQRHADLGEIEEAITASVIHHGVGRIPD